MMNGPLRQEWPGEGRVLHSPPVPAAVTSELPSGFVLEEFWAPVSDH